jgi:hypothetical protein
LFTGIWSRGHNNAGVNLRALTTEGRELAAAALVAGTAHDYDVVARQPEGILDRYL